LKTLFENFKIQDHFAIETDKDILFGDGASPENSRKSSFNALNAFDARAVQAKIFHDQHSNPYFA